MQKIGILGYGEIGKAIAKFYKDPYIGDLVLNSKIPKVDILNICIPYTRQFVNVVKNKIKKCEPSLTIIHSTVPVGTTQKIGGAVVHSPVRGVHPYLHRGIKIFVKFVGYDNTEVGCFAEGHFESLKIKIRLVKNSRNTEALKLWDTTQYGMMIVLNKEIKKYCEKNDLSFDIVYALANKTYNEGYVKLGRPEVVRPFLKHMPGKIGGHCVLPNCQILKDPIARFIKNKKY